jgi:hypothetical protein
MDTLTHLNKIIAQLKTNITTIAFTTAGLLVVVYCIHIMLNNDPSPAARNERWEKLKRVFLCVVLIAGAAVFISFAKNVAGML